MLFKNSGTSKPKYIFEISSGSLKLNFFKIERNLFSLIINIIHTKSAPRFIPVEYVGRNSPFSGAPFLKKNNVFSINI